MPDDDKNATVLTKEYVPQELHDREYLKPWLDKPLTKELGAEIFKKLDGAQSLLGKKAAPSAPAADAKEEDWDKFLDGLRPAKEDDYQIPLEKDQKADEGFLKVLKKGFYEGRINPRQASKMLATVLPELKAAAQRQQQAAAKQDADFQDIAKAAGQDQAALTRAKKVLNEYAPPALQPQLAKLDNASLVIMSVAINSILKKYVSEGELKTLGEGTAGGGAADKLAEARQLGDKLAKMSPMDPGYDELTKRVNAAYAEAVPG